MIIRLSFAFTRRFLKLRKKFGIIGFEAWKESLIEVFYWEKSLFVLLLLFSKEDYDV